MANEQTSVPLFAASEILTAANMNLSAGTGVPVFATTVTRDAAFGGAGEKVLAEGQLCYLSASNIVQYYDGAAWATVGPATAGGLNFIASSTFAAQSSVSINSCFTSTYTNYRVILATTTVISGGSQQTLMRLRAAGTDNTSGNYSWCRNVGVPASTNVVSASTAGTSFMFADGNTNLSTISFNVLDPQTAFATNVIAQAAVSQAGTPIIQNTSGFMTVSTAYDGFTIFTTSGTFSGTISVYGYSKA
jgi:hypothetical protein